MNTDLCKMIEALAEAVFEKHKEMNSLEELQIVKQELLNTLFLNSKQLRLSTDEANKVATDLIMLRLTKKKAKK